MFTSSMIKKMLYRPVCMVILHLNKNEEIIDNINELQNLPEMLPRKLQIVLTTFLNVRKQVSIW